jgi:hypothetical protein
MPVTAVAASVAAATTKSFMFCSTAAVTSAKSCPGATTTCCPQSRVTAACVVAIARSGAGPCRPAQPKVQRRTCTAQVARPQADTSVPQCTRGMACRSSAQAGSRSAAAGLDAGSRECEHLGSPPPALKACFPCWHESSHFLSLVISTQPAPPQQATGARSLQVPSWPPVPTATQTAHRAAGWPRPPP